MARVPWEPLMAAAARLIVAGVFLYAGVGKALDPAGFADAIGNYRLAPYPVAVALSLYLPWLEIIGGAGLLWGRTRRGAALVLGALCLVFAAVATSALVRGLDIACGCFGSGSAGHGSASLVATQIRALVLAGLCVAVFWFDHRSRLSARPPGAPEVPAAGVREA